MRCAADGTVLEDRRVPLPTIPHKRPGGQVARQNIVWFWESLDPLITARVNALVNGPFNLVLTVGTEATFYYIHRWELAAKACGAW